jgi:RimJ/RimL family protein N-acetyltransferase
VEVRAAVIAVPVLTDGAVTLRAHSEDDVAASLEQSLDPLSIRWTRVPVPYALDDAKRFVRVAMPGGWASDQEWAFAVEAEGRYCGTVSLRNQGEGRAEVAYGAHPSARGRGIVERALRLLLEWGFAERDLETVVWWAEKGNWASRKTAWRLGFSFDGTLRHWLPEREGLVDGWVGVLTRDDERAPQHEWLTAPRITGNGVVLRPHGPADLERVVQACNDERTAYWLAAIPEPYTADHGRQFLHNRIEEMASGRGLHWAIADEGSDLLLGTISLNDLAGQAGPEIGYWAHPDARGRGVVSEAVRLVARHVFIDTEEGGLGLPKVRLVSAVDNTASRRVAEANGFREVGTERLGTICREGRHDSVIYDLVI